MRFAECLQCNWYEAQCPYLSVLECPLSLLLESHAGKYADGLVEPGMIFRLERGWEGNINTPFKTIIQKIKYREDLEYVFGYLHALVFGDGDNSVNCHPLFGIAGTKDGAKNSYYGSAGETVW